MTAGQEKRIDSLEREVRKMNVVIKGVVDEQEENENETNEKLITIIQNNRRKYRANKIRELCRRLKKTVIC